MSANETQIHNKQNKRRMVMHRIYDLLDVGKETKQVSAAMFADDNISTHTVGDYIRDMVNAKILRRRMEYGTPTNGMGLGRHWHWTLLVSREEAERRLNLLDAEEMRTVAQNRSAETTDKTAVRVAKTDNGEVPVEAISGPDAPNPFDVLRPYRRVVAEPYALVEAARQYNERETKMEDSITSLIAQAKELGMEIDEQILRDSVSHPVTDDRLEAVTLVLPYITQLESAVARLIGQVEGLKEQVAELTKARMEITALRAQNERLIAKIASH